MARDALRTLEAQGIVEIKVGSGGGARIARGNARLFAESLAVQLDLTGVSVGEIMDAQRAIESLAAELAVLFGHDLADQPPVAMAQLRALRRFDATARLPQMVRISTMVVSATHDPIGPPRFGRALAEAIPGATFIEFPTPRTACRFSTPHASTDCCSITSTPSSPDRPGTGTVRRR